MVVVFVWFRAQVEVADLCAHVHCQVRVERRLPFVEQAVGSRAAPGALAGTSLVFGVGELFCTGQPKEGTLAKTA